MPSVDAGLLALNWVWRHFSIEVFHLVLCPGRFSGVRQAIHFTSAFPIATPEPFRIATVNPLAETLWIYCVEIH